MFKFNGIDHLNITVKNLDKSVDYYQRIFGFKILEDGDYNGTPYKIIGTSHKGMLCMYENKDLVVKNNNIGHYGFNIEFTDDIVEQLEKLQADVRYYNGEAIIQYPKSKSIYINDPDGNQIELSEVFAGGL